MDFLAPTSPNHAWKGLMTRMYAELIRGELGGLPTGAVLDLACGSGRFAVPMSLGGATVHGLDATLPSLQAAAAHLHGTDARLLWADVQELGALTEQLSPPYDAVLAIELLCYLPEPAQVLADARQLMKPGAPLIVSVEAWPGALLTDPGPLDAAAPDPLRTHTLHDPDGRWVHAYERAELARLLDDAGFDVRVIHGTHYVLDGPLGAFADPSRLDGAAYDDALLGLEQRLRDDPSLGGVPRAWLAIAQAR